MSQWPPSPEAETEADKQHAERSHWDPPNTQYKSNVIGRRVLGLFIVGGGLLPIGFAWYGVILGFAWLMLPFVIFGVVVILFGGLVAISRP